MSDYFNIQASFAHIDSNQPSWHDMFMDILTKALVDGAIVGAAICILGNGQEVLTATRKQHGTNWHWDAAIIRDVLGHRYLRTIAIGVLAGMVYAAISLWAQAVG